MNFGRYILYYLLKLTSPLVPSVMSSTAQDKTHRLNTNSEAQFYDTADDTGVHGISDFGRLIQFQNKTYVDKTLLIRDVFQDLAGILLITRPRRFGKSLLLSTLDYYVNVKFNDSEHLFSGLNIAKDTPELRKIKMHHMHKYAVIHLDFGGMKHSTFDKAMVSITKKIARAFKEHQYLLDGNALCNSDKKKFRDYKDAKLENRWLTGSIRFLCNCLQSYFKGEVDVIISMDEYDTPIHTSHSNGYDARMIAFFQKFYYASFKYNTDFKKAVWTGVTRIGKESLFSEVNNIETYTTFDHKFSSYCGFTEKEVDLLTERAGKGKEVRKILTTRYDGYTFGNMLIYNPWSVIFDLFQERPFKWRDSGSMHTLEIVLNSFGLYPVLTLQRLLANETVIKTVHEDLVYRDIDTDESSYWTLLVHLGYFTCDQVSDVKKSMPVTLRIPNQEVRLAIEDALYSDKARKLRAELPNYLDFVNGLVDGNYTFVKPAIESYVKNAGKFLRQPDQNYETERLTDYVTQMLSGVGQRYHTEMTITKAPADVRIEILPKNHEGNPVRVTLQDLTKVQETTTMSPKPSWWQRVKNSFCSSLKAVDKNKTEIYIGYEKTVLEVCVLR